MRIARPKRPLPRRRPVPMREIQAVVDQIVERFSPRKVILFGSHATGRARPESDVDLLVVLDKPVGPDASLHIRRAIRYAFPLDIVVSTSRRLAWRLAAGDFFLREAMEQGRVLYEKVDG